jgi:hypothetical protein
MVDLRPIDQMKFTDTSTAEGTFVISATGEDSCAVGSDCIGDGPGETIDVNPTFHVVYQDANVAYEVTDGGGSD